MNQKILVVDDEANIRDLLEYNLSNAGYTVISAANGYEALIKAEDHPNLILLDLMLPDLDGLEICKRLKGDKKTWSIPIIMLTARAEEIDKVLGLELGADDYITKPFSIRELLARVNALLRRTSKSLSSDEEKVSEKDGLVIDHDNYKVTLNEEKVDLTLKEFELLSLLSVNAGQVITRDAILESIWGYEYFGETRTVDVHIRHLRAKLNDDGHKYIETVRGVGYRFIKGD